jgi:hypothetical protein
MPASVVKSSASAGKFTHVDTSKLFYAEMEAECGTPSRWWGVPRGGVTLRGDRKRASNFP